jgi:hypothetical protein
MNHSQDNPHRSGTAPKQDGTHPVQAAANDNNPDAAAPESFEDDLPAVSLLSFY